MDSNNGLTLYDALINGSFIVLGAVIAGSISFIISYNMVSKEIFAKDKRDRYESAISWLSEIINCKDTDRTDIFYEWYYLINFLNDLVRVSPLWVIQHADRLIDHLSIKVGNKDDKIDETTRSMALGLYIAIRKDLTSNFTLFYFLKSTPLEAVSCSDNYTEAYINNISNLKTLLQGSEYLKYAQEWKTKTR